jgi:hypothetical protein
VVNVNAFDNVDRTLLRRTPANFEGEGEGTRLARRQRNWIGRVEFTAAADLAHGAARETDPPRDE